MATEIATALPMLELGPGATIEVDTGNAAAIVTGLVVYGTYYGPANPEGVKLTGVFLPVPEDDTVAV